MKTKQCKHKNINSKQCTAFAMNGCDYCYRHNPDISEEDKLDASSKGGKNSNKPEFIETPLPEMKLENMQDVVNLLADTVNNVRAGKISTKSGKTIGYLASLMIWAIKEAKAEKEQEEEKKMKAEGKWEPPIHYPTKVYHYKDEFYLDKNGNPLVVENDGSYTYPAKVFEPEHQNKTRHKHKKHDSKPMAPDKSLQKNEPAVPAVEEDQETFYREGTKKIVEAVKQSGILDGSVSGSTNPTASHSTDKKCLIPMSKAKSGEGIRRG